MPWSIESLKRELEKPTTHILYISTGESIPPFVNVPARAVCVVINIDGEKPIPIWKGINEDCTRVYNMLKEMYEKRHLVTDAEHVNLGIYLLIVEFKNPKQT